MKITSIDIWTVVVPTIPGRVHSPEWVPETGWDQVPKQILRINTGTELTGIGETGRGTEAATVAAGAARLVGRDPESITLRDIFREPADGTEEMLEIGTGEAYEAFEMAVFDLAGRMRGLPPTTGWATRPRRTAGGRSSAPSSRDSGESRSSAASRSRWSSGCGRCSTPPALRSR